MRLCKVMHAISYQAIGTHMGFARLVADHLQRIRAVGMADDLEKRPLHPGPGLEDRLKRIHCLNVPPAFQVSQLSRARL